MASSTTPAAPIASSAPAIRAGYPSAAFALSLIGGIFIVLAGLVIAALAAIVGSFALDIIPGAAAVIIALGLVGLILGIVIIALALRLKSDPNPGSTTMYGVVILVLAILSFPFAAGGFYIGGILAFIGGILAIVWKPGR